MASELYLSRQGLTIQHYFFYLRQTDENEI